MDVLAWLTDSDPALRWQVERDLLGAPPEVWTATKARVAHEGFGARLLAHQDPDGQWAGGAFFPRDFDESTVGTGEQPWTATTWSLNSLREWGVDARVLQERDTVELLDRHCRWEYDDLPYWGGEVDCCINAWTLANGVWLGADVDGIATWFLEHQLDDGGWNCEWIEGSRRSSFHSTLNGLTGLLAYEIDRGDILAVRAARLRGEEFLLSRDLFRRLSTGQTVAPWVDRFVYPSRWRYSVLRAADYFRQATAWTGTRPDPRMADAIAIIRSARVRNGTWLQGERQPGQVWFDVDVDAGMPSMWLTFFCLRVLAWWDGHSERGNVLSP